MALVSDKEGSHVKVSVGPEDAGWCFRFTICCSRFLFFSFKIMIIFNKVFK